MSPDARLAAFKHGIAGRYLIDAEAGRGGMAVVYLARDVRLGRPVAVKVLAPEVASPGTVSAFRRESIYTLRLEHPNILPVLDVGEAEGLPFYVMRYVRGGSLRRRLERARRLSVGATVPIMRQAAAALEHAHGQRILHCDVKPENILLEGDHVYLADFGISRTLRVDAFDGYSTAAIGSGGGTASYVSPEQALDEPTLDQRTDLYSLACVVYEMLAGRTPFTGASDREILARRLTSAVAATHELPRAVPDAVRAAIARALSLAPEDRHRSVAAFVAAFEASVESRRSRTMLGGVNRIVTRWASALAAPRSPRLAPALHRKVS